MEAFPRGRGEAAEVNSAAEKPQKTKRKATPAAAEDNDFLFGQRKTKDGAPGKRRKGDAAATTTPSSAATEATAVARRAEIGSGMVVRAGKGRPSRLELVSFKKLNKGVVMLGVVTKVRRNEAVVSLPSGTAGVVRMAEVSDHHFAEHAKQAVQRAKSQMRGAAAPLGGGGEGSGADDSEDDEGKGEISGAQTQPKKEGLVALLSPGQVVRCYVLALSKGAAGRRVELSLRPSLVNLGMSTEQLRPGAAVYGCVASVEDHGYVINVGVEGVHAFLNRRDHPGGAELLPGQPVEAIVKAYNSEARTATLSTAPKAVAAAVAEGGPAVDLRGVKPGMLVNGVVAAVLSNGMLVSFMGFFVGGLDHNHMEEVAPDEAVPSAAAEAAAAAGLPPPWKAAAKVGDAVKARVLLVDYANKAIRLTMRPHLMAMRGPQGLPPVGAVVEDAVVVRVDPKLGVLLALPPPPAGGYSFHSADENDEAARSEEKAEPVGSSRVSGGGSGGRDGSGSSDSVGAYVHISRLSDSRTEHADQGYKPGQAVTCRVLGQQTLEGWASASLQPSVLKARVLRPADAKAAALLTGTVVGAKGNGLSVRLGPGVTAVCTALHLSDATSRRTVQERFKEGAPVKVRVLSTDAKRGQIFVTLKKSLVRDKTPPITSYGVNDGGGGVGSGVPALPGTVATGFITRIGDFGVVVTFYNNVHGLLPARTLARLGVEDPVAEYRVGQVLRCVVVRCDAEATPPKLTLSLDVPSGVDGSAAAAAAAADAAAAEAASSCPYKDGDVVAGVVAANDGEVLTLTLDNCSRPAALAAGHLVDHPAFAATAATTVAVGSRLDNLLVLELPRKAAMPIVLTRKPLLLAAAVDGADSPGKLPGDVSELVVGEVVVGTVSRVEEFGAFVRFRAGLSALVPRSLAAEGFVADARQLFAEFDSVRAVVHAVDPATGRISLSCKPSTVPPSGALFLSTLLKEEEAAASIAANDASGEEGRPLPDWRKYPVGSVVSATVAAERDYGLVLTANDEATMLLCPPLETAETAAVTTPETAAVTAQTVSTSRPRRKKMQQGDEVDVAAKPDVGDSVQARVLAVDFEKRVLDATTDAAAVAAAASAENSSSTRKKKKKAAAPPAAGTAVTAEILLAREGAQYAVALLGGLSGGYSGYNGRLGLLLVSDYHCPYRRAGGEEGNLAASGVKAGDSVHTVVADLGPEGGPYAGVPLLLPPDDAAAREKRRRATDKAENRSEGRAERGAGRQLPSIAEEALLPGADVWCLVRAVDAERIEAAICVEPSAGSGSSGYVNVPTNGNGDGNSRNGKTSFDSADGARGAGGKRKASMDSVDGEGGGRRRRRSSTLDSLDGLHGSGQHVLRAIVHVTDAAKPGLEAPAATPQEGSSGSGGGADKGAAMPEWHPFAKIRKGDVIRARALSVPMATTFDAPAGRSATLRLSIDPAVLALPLGQLPPPQARPDWHDAASLVAGNVYRGVVQSVADGGGVWVHLSSSVRGLVSLVELSENINVLTHPARYFPRGSSVTVAVLSVDASRRHLDLSLRAAATAAAASSALQAAAGPPATAGGGRGKKAAAAAAAAAAGAEAARPLSPAAVLAAAGWAGRPLVGAVVVGVIDRRRPPLRPPALGVRLRQELFGHVCATEVADAPDWKTGLLDSFDDGQVVRCLVLPGGRNNRLELSLRPSRLAAAVAAATPAAAAAAAATGGEPWAEGGASSSDDNSLPPEGAVVTGFVASTTARGCVVNLSRTISAHVLLKDLADVFVNDPPKDFPPGRVVAGRVLSRDTQRGTVKLTLKPSVVVPSGGFLSYNTIRKGMKVSGVVAAVQSFGVFVQLKDSDVRGMCHRSEAADQPVADLTGLYEQGDHVKAVVLKVDAAKKRVSLGLKASYFEGDADTSDEESDDDAGSEAGDENGAAAAAEEGSDADAVAAAAAQDSDEEQAAAEEEVSDEESEEEGDEMEQDSDSDGSVSGSSGEDAAAAGGGSGLFATAAEDDEAPLPFQWDSFGKAGASGAASDDDEEEDDSDGEGAGGDGPKSGHKSRGKAAEKRREEEKLRAREAALLDGGSAPETTGDFERLLVASPNAAALWVQYMAFHLALADVEAARGVAERALRTISFREEGERLDVWKALLNLEHKFGGKEALASATARAAANVNPKRVYLHVAEAHEAAEEDAEAEAAFAATARKFKGSKKVWIAWLIHRLRRGDDTGARELLRRSLQSLPKRKHVAVTLRLAQAEFQFGSAERGRVLFEGLVGSHPRRLDIWNVFIDKEIKAGDIVAARSLFQRLVHMGFNSKRMKGIFKKFLRFEEEHGDTATAEAVKQAAREYVASLVE